MTESFFIARFCSGPKESHFLWCCEEGKNCWRCHRDPSHCLPPSVPLFPPPPFSFSRTGSQVYDVKLFPEDPVELIVGETLTLNCTALVEFNAGVDIKWSYPGKLVQSSFSWWHFVQHRWIKIWISDFFPLTRQTVGWTLSPIVTLCPTLQRLLASWPSTVWMSQILARTAATSPALTPHKSNKLRL